MSLSCVAWIGQKQTRLDKIPLVHFKLVTVTCLEIINIIIRQGIHFKVILLSRSVWQVKVYNNRENVFGRQGLEVKCWWFKTFVGISVFPRGNKAHWGNPLPKNSLYFCNSFKGIFLFIKIIIGQDIFLKGIFLSRFLTQTSVQY